jgi:hypothetical protein
MLVVLELLRALVSIVGMIIQALEAHLLLLKK